MMRRALSTSMRVAAQSEDLVQAAFLSKVREYGANPAGLLSSSAEAKKALDDELNRLAQKYHLDSTNVGKLPTDFTKASVKSSVAELLEGKSVDEALAAAKKATQDYKTKRA